MSNAYAQWSGRQTQITRVTGFSATSQKTDRCRRLPLSNSRPFYIFEKIGRYQFLIIYLISHRTTFLEFFSRHYVMIIQPAISLHPAMPLEEPAFRLFCLTGDADPCESNKSCECIRNTDGPAIGCLQVVNPPDNVYRIRPR